MNRREEGEMRAMKIKEISYRRVRNLGNFETETIEMKAEVDDSEDPIDVFSELKFKTSRLLGFRAKKEDISYIANEAFQTDEGRVEGEDDE